MKRDRDTWPEKGKNVERGVWSKTHIDVDQDCAKASAYSHLADRFLCHYATAEKAAVFPSYVCLFTRLLKSQTEKVEGRLLAVPDIRLCLFVSFRRYMHGYRPAGLLAERL